MRRLVYFLRVARPAGPVKIGVSDNPHGRLVSYRAWCPDPVEIIATFPGDPQTERRFHALFADLHTHGEWFSWSPEIAATVEAINGGRFSVDALPEPRALPMARKPRPQSVLAGVNTRKVQKLRAAGIAVPDEVSRSLNTYRCEPAERDRRRALVGAWLQRQQEAAA